MSTLLGIPVLTSPYLRRGRAVLMGKTNQIIVGIGELTERDKMQDAYDRLLRAMFDPSLLAGCGYGL